jgi:hypothetical protein
LKERNNYKGKGEEVGGNVVMGRKNKKAHGWMWVGHAML